MRTNIVIDDTLLTEAMALTGSTTKKGAVERALQTLIEVLRQRRAMDDLQGIGWDADLDEIRASRPI